MLRTDSFECAAALPARKAIQWIRAEDIETVCFGYLVPQMFKLNRCLRFTLCPEKGRTFTAYCNANRLSLGGPGCFRKEISCNFKEFTPIRQIVYHYGRRSLGSIQPDVSPLLNRGGNIQTMRVEP